MTQLTLLLLKILAIVVALGALWVAGDVHGRHAEQQKKLTADNAQRERVMRQEHVQIDRAQESASAEETNRQKQAARDRVVRGELQRLRDALAERDLPAAPACAPVVAYTASADGVVGECADRYSQVAHDFGECKGRLEELQRLIGPAAASGVTP